MALAIFVVLASLTVAISVMYYALGGDGGQRTLDGWKDWPQHNNHVVMAVLFLVFGVVLISLGDSDPIRLSRRSWRW